MSAKAQDCSACGKPMMVVEKARAIQFCHGCEQKWQDSPERVQAATARARFAERMAKEAK